MNKKIEMSFLILFVVICGIIGAVFGIKKNKPTERIINITARKYGYEPDIIRINRGDKITLKLNSEDVTHGFYLEGYDFDAKVRPQTPYFWIRQPSKDNDYDKSPVESYTFTADKIGKFRYRCSVNCGSFHPFMQGELIVEPNYLFPVSVGLAIGLSAACIVYLGRREDRR